MVTKDIKELFAAVDKLNRSRFDDLRWIGWRGGELEPAEPVLWMECRDDGVDEEWRLVEGSILRAPEKFGQYPKLRASDTGAQVDGRDIINLFYLRKLDSSDARAADAFEALDSASCAQAARAKQAALELAGMVELHSFDDRDEHGQPLPMLVRASSILRASDARLTRYHENGMLKTTIEPACHVVFADGTHAISVVEPAYTVLERVAHVLRANRVPDPFEVLQQVCAELERMGVFKSPFKAPPPAPGASS